MKQDPITINGDGGKISISDFSKIDKRSVVAKIKFISDWFEGGFYFEASVDRINEFERDLGSAVLQEKKRINFINEEGSVDIGINVGDRGNCLVTAVFSKSMIDGCQVRQEFNSDVISLESFWRALRSRLHHPIT